MAEMTMYLDKLQKRLEPASDEQEATAAVAVLLERVGAEIQILLVKRVKNMRDPWSGQVAFPGGKRDNTDVSLKDTIIRETQEETGIDLHTNSRFMGTLPALTSRPRPQMKIVPFIFFLEKDQPITLSQRELESYAWLPVNLIAKSKSITQIGTMEVPAFTIGKTVVWGFTFRILEFLIEILVEP